MSGANPDLLGNPLIHKWKLDRAAPCDVLLLTCGDGLLEHVHLHENFRLAWKGFSEADLGCPGNYARIDTQRAG